MAAALCTDQAAERQHDLLVNKLHDEIGEEKIKEMRQLLRPILKKNLGTFDVRAILNALTDKGVIRVGEYSYLKQVLSDIHIERLLEIVEETEIKIKTLLGSNTAEEIVHGESQENGEGSKRKRTDTCEPSWERYADLQLKLEIHKIERDKQANEVILEIAKKAITGEVLQNSRKRKRILSDLLQFKAELVGPIRTGSILLTVRFYSLEDLTYFWSKYKDGTVTAALSDILLSDKIIEISQENHVEFYVTCDISEDACVEACGILLGSEDEAPDTVNAVARMSITDDTQGKEAIQEGPSHEQMESKSKKDFDASGSGLVEEAETGCPVKSVPMQERHLRAWASVQRSIIVTSDICEQEPINVGVPEETEEMRKELKSEPACIEEASTERTRAGEQEPMFSDAFLELSANLENELRELVQSAEEASKKLHSLADEIDEHLTKCNRGKTAGSAAALVGFPLMAVGFGLAFVTFGASLGLSIAGAALSGLGGLTAAGSGLAENFITKSKCRVAQEAVNAVNEKAEACKETLEKLKNKVFNSISARIHTGTCASNVARGIGIPVLNGIRLAAGLADEPAATVFRRLGTGLPDVVHSGRLVVSSLLVPYDIYTLASSSVKEYRITGSPQANKIREVAIEMHCLAQDGSAFLNPEDIEW